MRIQCFFLALSLLATTTDAFVPHRVAFTRASAAAGALEASKLERLPESAVQVTIPVPGSATKAAYEKACDELCRTITIPGFRKGAKVPPQVLEQSMAAKGGRYALKAQAITELLAQFIEPALKDEHGVEPLGKPVLETPAEEMAKDFIPGEDLELVVKCDVWPDIEWQKVEGQEKPYIGLTGKYERKPFDQAKFNKSLNDLKERFVELKPIDDGDHELQMGDACVVNMEGFMATADGEKGEPLPNAASGDSVEVVMGEGRYMTGLVEGLVGAKVGEMRKVSVRFPDVSLLDLNLCYLTRAMQLTIFNIYPLSHT
jgi:trigger factor